MSAVFGLTNCHRNGGKAEIQLHTHEVRRLPTRHDTTRHAARRRQPAEHAYLGTTYCLSLLKRMYYLRVPSYSPSRPSCRRRDLDLLSLCSASAFCLLSSSSGCSRSHQNGFSRSKRVAPMPRHSQESEGPEDARSAAGDRFWNRALHLLCCGGCFEERAGQGEGSNGYGGQGEEKAQERPGPNISRS